MPVKYLGSKRAVLPYLMSLVTALDLPSALDLFTGSVRVAVAMKQQGLYVVANDTASYSHVLAKTFIELDADTVDVKYLTQQVEMTNLYCLPRDGYFTQTFSREARYFQEHNARRIDGILDHISRVDDPTLKAVLQTSLLLAADKVDNTVGVQMAYLKQWCSRSYNTLHLEMPTLLPGLGKATQEDALHLALQNCGTALAFLDPPYNQHSYAGNYHIWETLIRNDKPEAYGVARKRVDVKTRRSPYNSKKTAYGELEAVVAALDWCPYIIASFSNEGFITKAQMEEMLGEHGYTESVSIPHRRYVGASIGCYSPTGVKVGEPSHTRNQEYLFLSGPDKNKVHQAVNSVREML